MFRFSKEAYYGCSSECIDTKHCEPWVLAYDKHMCILNENGGWEVIPDVDDIENDNPYFRYPAHVHKNWVVWSDDDE